MRSLMGGGLGCWGETKLSPVRGQGQQKNGMQGTTEDYDVTREGKAGLQVCSQGPRKTHRHGGVCRKRDASTERKTKVWAWVVLFVWLGGEEQSGSVAQQVEEVVQVYSVALVGDALDSYGPEPGIKGGKGGICLANLVGQSEPLTAPTPKHPKPRPAPSTKVPASQSQWIPVCRLRRCLEHQ